MTTKIDTVETVDTVDTKPISLLGKFVQILTRGRVEGGGAVYYRAKVVKELSDRIVVSYYGKPEKCKDDLTSGEMKPELKTDTIRDIDIVRICLFKD